MRLLTGNSRLSQPAIWAGAHCSLSLLATSMRSRGRFESAQVLGRSALFQAWASACCAGYFIGPPLRSISRPIVDGARFRLAAMRFEDQFALSPREIASRSSGLSARGERFLGGGAIPPRLASIRCTEPTSRSSARAISLTDSAARQRFQISSFWVDVNHGFACRFIASSSDFRIGTEVLQRPVESALHFFVQTATKKRSKENALPPLILKCP